MPAHTFYTRKRTASRRAKITYHFHNHFASFLFLHSKIASHLCKKKLDFQGFVELESVQTLRKEKFDFTMYKNNTICSVSQKIAQKLASKRPNKNRWKSRSDLFLFALMMRLCGRNYWFACGSVWMHAYVCVLAYSRYHFHVQMCHYYSEDIHLYLRTPKLSLLK